MNHLIPVDPQLLFSRNDSADPRLGDLSKQMKADEFFSSSLQWGLIGYPDDEGISLNGGRLGAALAPDKIRRSFYKMTPSLFSRDMPGMADLGNLSTDISLSERHEAGRKIMKSCFENDKKMASLGGGHDYGYSDVSGFLDVYAGQRPLVINLDAHLDVRPLDRGLSSGTPFFRVLSEFKGEFDFVELGIQSQCNSQNHLHWAQNHGAQVIFMEEIWQKGLLPALEPFLKLKRPTFMSIDIDGFTSNEAPGCSQSWTTGLSSIDLIKALPALHTKVDLRGLAIYEVSPPLDQDDRTSKLAALLLHHFFYL